MKKKDTNKTVVLLGTSETLVKTPWDNKEYDYWACFSVFTQPIVIGHRIDAWFELHPEETWEQFKDKLLKAEKIYPDAPIYMQRVEKKIKNSALYPLKEIQDMTGNMYLRKYFTSSIAFMVAMAIYKGYKKIILHGISLAVDEEEYSKQRSCVEAWLNYGLGKGVQYVISQPAALMSCNYVYGYEQHKDVMIKLVQTREEINNALVNLQNQEREAHDAVKVQEGGKLALDAMIKRFRS